MPSIKSFLVKPREIEIPRDGEAPLQATITANNITPIVDEEMRQLATDGRMSDYMIRFLVLTVVDWNLEDGDGKKVAISTEGLRAIPVVATSQIFNEVYEELNNPKN